MIWFLVRFCIPLKKADLRRNLSNLVENVARKLETFEKKNYKKTKSFLTISFELCVHVHATTEPKHNHFRAWYSILCFSRVHQPRIQIATKYTQQTQLRYTCRKALHWSFLFGDVTKYRKIMLVWEYAVSIIRAIFPWRRWW